MNVGLGGPNLSVSPGRTGRTSSGVGVVSSQGEPFLNIWREKSESGGSAIVVEQTRAHPAAADLAEGVAQFVRRL